MTITMHLKGETTNKFRYQEDGGDFKLGGMYICKNSFDGKPAPKTILVTIRGVEEG